MDSDSEPFMLTYTGRRVRPWKLQPSDVCREDIAQALGNIVRFTGHCDQWTVADHSVLCSYLVPPEHALAALLHDAAEAYVGDMSHPLKRYLGMVRSGMTNTFREIEATCAAAVARHFGLAPMAFDHHSVHEADQKAAQWELWSFMGKEGAEIADPEAVRWVRERRGETIAPSFSRRLDDLLAARPDCRVGSRGWVAEQIRRLIPDRLDPIHASTTRNYLKAIRDTLHQDCCQDVRRWLFRAAINLRYAISTERGSVLTPEEHLQLVREKIEALREAGQKEYAHDEGDAFANFTRVGAGLGICRTAVLKVYALKHLDGIQAHLDGHKSQREDVLGRCDDFGVYMGLHYCMGEQDRLIEEAAV